MLYKSPGHYIFDTYHGRMLDPDYPLWLNLGYWRDADRYVAACEALADLVAEEARLAPNDRLVDAGCGFCEPARHWLRRTPGLSILSLNNNSMQVDIARKRLAAADVAGRIEVDLADAVRLPARDASVDKVIALESAFHFDTREQFMRAAFAALRPGGRLVVADLLPLEEEGEGDAYRSMIRRHGSIPEANMYGLETLIRIASQIGFDEVRGRSIRGYVFPGAARLAEAIRDGCADANDARIKLEPDEVDACRGVEYWSDHNGLSDFVILSATKK